MSVTRDQPQARLPAARREPEIQDMQPGDSGWTVPWAMWADAEHLLWLHGGYTIHSSPGGTVQMRVWRDERDGYWRVDCSACRSHKWSGGGGVYAGQVVPIAVAEVQF